MIRKKAANFEELARRILAITDGWKQARTVQAQTDGSLPEITKLLTLCFGPDGAEAIARELIREIELYEPDADNDANLPEADQRIAQLASLLRQEFAD